MSTSRVAVGWDYDDDAVDDGRTLSVLSFTLDADARRVSSASQTHVLEASKRLRTAFDVLVLTECVVATVDAWSEFARTHFNASCVGVARRARATTCVVMFARDDTMTPLSLAVSRPDGVDTAPTIMATFAHTRRPRADFVVVGTHLSASASSFDAEARRARELESLAAMLAPYARAPRIIAGNFGASTALMRSAAFARVTEMAGRDRAAACALMQYTTCTHSDACACTLSVAAHVLFSDVHFRTRRYLAAPIPARCVRREHTGSAHLPVAMVLARSR